MKLNLACGTDIRDGWINLDIVPKWPTATRACDVIWDARKDKIPFIDDSADEIYASYLLLHLAPRHHEHVLADIRRVIKPTGVLTVGEVDMEIVMKRYINNPLDARLSELIWGEQGAGPIRGPAFLAYEEFDKHCQGFTFASLQDILLKNGFNNLKRTKIHHQDVWYELTITCSKNA